MSAMWRFPNGNEKTSFYERKRDDEMNQDTEMLIQHCNSLIQPFNEPLIVLEEKYDKEKLRSELPSTMPDDFLEFFSCIGNTKPSICALVDSMTEDGFYKKFFGTLAFEFFHPIEGSFGLVDDLDGYEGRMPSWLIRFAPDYMANHFVLSIRKSDYGTVYMWLSDYEFDDEEDGELEEYDGNLVPIANSFSEFILKLKINQEYLDDYIDFHNGNENKDN